MKNTIIKIVLLLFSLQMNSQCLNRDLSFGTGAGVYNYSSYSYFNPIMLSDYKFLSLINGTSIARFNENGSADSLFGINGIFTVPSIIETIYDVSVQNGYIYFVGQLSYNPTTYFDAFILRLTYDGNLDSTFGINGIVRFHTTENEEFHKMIITPNNKIIAFGKKYSDPWNKLVVARFNFDGTVDNSFQNNGYKEIYVFPVNTGAVQNISEIQNNTYYVACTGQPQYGNDNSQLVLLKLDLDGNLDVSLNGTGRLVVQSGISGESYVKFFGNKLCYMTHEGYIYTNAYLHKYDISTFQSNVITVDYAATDYFFTDNFSKVTVLSSTALPGNAAYRNLWIKTYNIDGSSETSFCNTGIFEFNLSDSNNFSTDDISRRIFLVNNNILVSGYYRPLGDFFGTFRPALTRFVDGPLSTDSFIESQIIAFPNPVENVLNISAKKITYPITFEVVNLLGQMLLKSTILYNDNSNQIQIDISTLETSQYIFKLIDGNNKKHEVKFLKK